MSTGDDQDDEQPRGPDGPGPAAPPSPFANPRAWSLMVPVVFGTGMLLAGAAWLVAVRTTSNVAAGPEVEVTYDSPCAAAAIDARLADYGFPGTWRGSVLRLTLAGVAGEEAVPAALAAPGVLILTHDGAPVPFVVEHGGLQLSLQGTPVALFTMQANLPTGDLVATLDGAPLEIESVNGNELMLAARGSDSTQALRIATDYAVAVNHPLPCAVKVLGVVPAASPVR